MTVEPGLNENENTILDEIMEELDTSDFERLPKSAIEAARKHRDQIIPLLIESIAQATERARKGEYVEENSHFYAFYLLTEFEAKEALPAIVDSVLLPGETPHDLYGDTITEKLQGCLAALSNPPFEEIERIISCDEADEYVRWAAAGSYLYLVRDGKLTREEAVHRLKRHLVNAIEKETVPLISYLICELSDYSPHEAEAEIRQAFEADLVDEITINLRGIEESLRGGDHYFQTSLSRCRPTGIDDTIAELSKWASFKTPPPATDSEFLDEDDWDYRDDSDTIRNLNPKIGRNDPCPCDSGKKYKKCCGKS
ncbi:MAG: DUF1186 domain-containing protein [Planctomycetaceae bacterium]|nr:DUF1186 domain-containing protein [Planctomycetaceae bacterium]